MTKALCISVIAFCCAISALFFASLCLYERIHQKRVKVDTTVPSGEYCVTFVDIAGNESAMQCLPITVEGAIGYNMYFGGLQQ